MPRYDFARFLNVRNAYSPSPSPDGSRVAFLSDITGVPQVWSVPVEGGWPEQLTYYAERVATVEYSPAGDRVLFGMDAGGNERQGLYSVSPDGATVEPLAVADDVIHSWGAWSPDGSHIAYTSNTRDRRYFDVYVRPVDGEPRCVLQQDGTNGVVDWSSDGRALLISRTRGLYSDTDLYLLDLASGAARLLTEHEGEAYHGSPHSVGEDTLLLVASRDREFAAPARLALRTGELRYLAETEWDAEELAASADGRVVAYTLNEEGYSRLRLEVGGEPRPVAGLADGVIVGLKLSQDGSTLVFAHYGATRNGNVWAVDTATGQARQVTHATRAGLPDEALAEPRLVRYPTFDGREIPAFLYLPSGALMNQGPAIEPPVPVVVHVHGGPEGQARPSFNPTIQYLVNLGFGVLATNVRGSTGYGKTYAHLDDVRKRMDSVADLEAAVRWLRESGIGRPDAIAVMGGSYGGFMTLAAITTYPDIWAAAVDTVGIANFVTFLEQTGPWRRTLREVEYGSLERDRDFLEAISPINHVDKITAPLLVIHGANDPRVPIGEAEQIVASLRARGREVDYLRFEDEGHGLVKLPNRIRAAERTAAFLEQHLARA